MPDANLARSRPARRRESASIRRVWRFITDYVAKHGYPPTVREISDGTGLRSTSSVNHCIGQLERKGWLSREFGSARGLTLLRTPDGSAGYHVYRQGADSVGASRERLTRRRVSYNAAMALVDEQLKPYATDAHIFHQDGNTFTVRRHTNAAFVARFMLEEAS